MVSLQRKLGPWLWMAGLSVLLIDRACGAEAAYDPLAIPDQVRIETLDLTVVDADRQRELPLRVYLPPSREPAPVVLFSHGLGGSRENNPYLGKHWAARGFVVVFLQHPGSDESVWRDVTPLARLAAMRRAANAQNTLLRFQDVPAVIDQLEQWQTDAASPLHGRLDLAHVGMSGHSFGAVTTQGVSGQRTPRGRALFTDARIKAALAMSPNAPAGGGDPSDLFGQVAIPWLLMTGTKDTARIGDATVESRLAVYPALPPGDKYELVLHDAEHSAFGDRALPGDSETRNPNHHRAILAISTAFWECYLRGDAGAREWLQGTGPRSVLEPEDRWQHK